MNTLTISDIFANLADYQDQYLSIISNPEQYYTPVESAYIDVWPVGCTDLYLGDLLQLWFSERWLVNSPCQLLSEQSTTTLKKTVQREHDLYLYQLSGSALSGSNHSKVWSAAEGKSLEVSLDSAFKYYCIYKGVERPDASKLQTLKTFKTAI